VTAVVGRLAAAVAASCLLAALAVPAAAGAETTGPGEAAPAPSIDESLAGTTYAGDADAEALLVAGEERRLANVRAIANAADWSGAAQYKPYRLATGKLYTLVLVARDAPYTISDLEKLAPRTFARQPDGAYLLSENIVVDEGASLDLSDSDGLTLHLASSAESFVSIITLGGSFTVQGTASEPAEITSWDGTDGKSDTDTTDGRSYIRVVGGHADIGNTTFTDLGFWSGATGGLSLTGTDALDIETAALATGKDKALAAGESANPEVFGSELLPADGGAELLPMDADLTSYSYVSALINNATFDGNAFGVFITSAEGVVIRDTVVKNSLVDGIIMHRYVTNSEISRTSSHDNARNGIMLTRGTSGIVLDRVTSKVNGANGISLNGRPLADGPSATGTPVGSYGNNEVSNSVTNDNGRYGIDVLGGTRVQLDSNEVNGNTMGIVVGAGAEEIVVKNNLVAGSVEQGIAFRAAGTDALVRGNTVTGGEIGIYARDAGGTFERNTVEDVTNHAITLIGATGDSVVEKNTVAGSGPSAIDVARAGETVVLENDLESWRSTKPLDVVLRGIFQPLTVMWLLLGLLLVISAVSSIGRKHTGFTHPYENLAPLSSYSKGVVDRDTFRTKNPTGRHA
jgi:nitrous oxidase accessory protein NosD